MSRRCKKKIDGLATEVVQRQGDQGRADLPRIVRWWRDSRYYRGLGSVPAEELRSAVARKRADLSSPSGIV